MIKNSTIRKLVRGMTDNQVCNLNGKVLLSEKAWGKSSIIFLENPPQVAADWHNSREVKMSDVENFCCGELEECWVTFVGELLTYFVSRLETKTGETFLVNGKYVSTLLKKSGRKSRYVKWYVHRVGGSQILVAKSGEEVIGFCAEFFSDEDEWVWWLKNEDLPISMALF